MTTVLSTTEIMERLSNILTAPITDTEAGKAVEQAEKKLNDIISREGDADGVRREPWYFWELVKESLKEIRTATYIRGGHNITLIDRDKKRGIERQLNTSRKAGLLPNLTSLLYHRFSKNAIGGTQKWKKTHHCLL